MLEIFTQTNELPTGKSPLDPDTEQLLIQFQSEDETSIFDFAIDDVRNIFNPIFEQSAVPAPEVAEGKECTINCDNQAVNIIEITPKGDVPVDGWPTLIFLHGGGWILGNYSGYEWLAKSLSHACGMKVIFVDYGLSPEHRFPTALDQVIAVIEHIHANANQMEINSDKIGIVGDSAGGNLAAATSIKIRDAGGEIPPVQMQCLIYPFIDLRPGIEYASRTEFGNGDHFLTTEHIDWSRYHYLLDAAETESPLVSPITLTSFEGLPITLVVTAGYDPLKDEGHAFHLALLDAGVKSTLLHYRSTIHAFLSFSAQLRIARTAIDNISHQIISAMS